DVVLRRAGSPLRVTDLAVRVERLPVYNLHVDVLHTFAVGATGVLVHNRMPDEKAGKGSWNGTLDSKGNGTWTSTDARILKVVAPGKKSVTIVFKKGEPNFTPWLVSVGGVKAKVKISLSGDATVSASARARQDFRASDQAFVALLAKKKVVNPATGE